jgi:hypothetical protein
MTFFIKPIALALVIAILQLSAEELSAQQPTASNPIFAQSTRPKPIY